ncbi:MAG: heme exporter protein CcmB [Gammaproteobacteria bacterium HGW-Gammaproteobacteria-5]|jgi:heme exporter protein B|nr:MAG: heme exporter protein CcmB [Gammaproteobacteria bacterium HGW-Gammaproteobacteria-5]PKM15055.1 MAG: heme exporter protein CcmB [Gammaproteobacteria bacterium HGW-Gammaproteobacteria-2]
MASATARTALLALLRRDLLLVWRRRGDALQPAMFAVLTITLFPLALGSEPQLLARIASGVIWVAVVLAGMLSLDALFRSDLEDGSLEQLLLSPQPLALLIFGKVLVHWLTTALPVLVATPLFAAMLQLDSNLYGVLVLSLLLGTPLLSLIGAVVVALTVGMKRSGMLLALLALPLYVPVLIFGAGSVMAASQGLPYLGALLVLGAALALALVLAPLAAAAAIRIALS